MNKSKDGWIEALFAIVALICIGTLLIPSFMAMGIILLCIVIGTFLLVGVTTFYLFVKEGYEKIRKKNG